MRSENKVALVTGGGRGIGRAIALALASEGAGVVVADLDLRPAEETAEEVRSRGCRALALGIDVSDPLQVGRMVDVALDLFGKIDILVNNAAILKAGPASKMEESDWRKVVEVNLTAQFLCSQAVGRQMIKQKGGKIVFIGSTTAHRASPGLAAYSAAKAGVLQLARVLAVEWARHGINVNSVSPGSTSTPMVQGIQAEYEAFVRDRIAAIPLHRVNTPSDLAKAVLFLASSDSDNITGQDIVVDGGICAISPASAVAMALASQAI